LYLSIAECALR